MVRNTYMAILCGGAGTLDNLKSEYRRISPKVSCHMFLSWWDKVFCLNVRENYAMNGCLGSFSKLAGKLEIKTLHWKFFKVSVCLSACIPWVITTWPLINFIFCSRHGEIRCFHSTCWNSCPSEHCTKESLFIGGKVISFTSWWHTAIVDSSKEPEGIGRLHGKAGSRGHKVSFSIFFCILYSSVDH